MKDYLESLTGIKTIWAVFGFFGGCLSLSMAGAKTPIIAIASVFAGLCCAMAFTPAVRELWNYPAGLEPAISFTLGVAGMSSVKFIYENLNAQTFSRIFSRWLNKGVTPVDETIPKK